MSEVDCDRAFEFEPEILRTIAAVSTEFDRQWQAGQSPRIEDFIKQLPASGLEQGLQELLGSEIDRRLAAGESPSVSDYLTRFALHQNLVRHVFFHRDATLIRDLQTTAPEGSPTAASLLAAPAKLGRFLIERELGRGTFAVVYLATDPSFPRQVALKIPHSERVETEGQRVAFIRDAQFAAQLNHPGVVTVYEIDTTGPVPVIVQEFMPGGDLKQCLSAGDVSSEQAAAWMIQIAEAVSAAHKKGFFHRDLKPANILLDSNQQPRVADFGLALHERDQLDCRSEFAGTLAYMSPEQVRCETNRLDGRSDTWSLGVILYEMLVGKRPFSGPASQLSEQIKTREPRPPREIKPQISSELQRICLKCLEKRASRRYASAQDLADDLRHWQIERERKKHRTRIRSRRDEKPSSELASAQEPSQPVIPKGLRSFDSHDADFYLDLLPGTRDRAGLPDSVRFWKALIEERDPANTYSVGVLYGPSGCGKSSLVKAGILPRLSPTVVALYVEATPAETETRLVNGLRRMFPDIPPESSLPSVLAGLRDRRWGMRQQKLLVIIDQFEQWLHSARMQQPTELVDALRHCDGEHLQCLLLVREEFWTGVSRFMQELEIPLQEQRNALMVDRFDLSHARKVMVQFGRAYGQLPELPVQPGCEHQQFLDEALEQLNEEGRVICVRLAVFCEMFKSRPWTPASLKAVGGIEGVGATFLEEAFSAKTTPAEHRAHQVAIRAILNCLLPAAGTDIKGQMRSEQELQAVSGYGQRPADFAAVMRILDTNTRLITPTEPPVGTADRATDGESRVHYYQLTHDYLVHSLRAWLTYKQRETRRGRAELQLDELSQAWNSKPASRLLPSPWQWVQISLLTSRRLWTPRQHKMMAAADRWHLLRGLSFVLLVVLGGWSWHNFHSNLKAHALRDRLLDATLDEVPTIVGEMAPHGRRMLPLLEEAESPARSAQDSRRLLNISLARLPFDNSQVEYLTSRLLQSEPHELPVIRDALRAHKVALRDQLWNVLQSNDEQAKQHRLQAAAALADYDDCSESRIRNRWGEVAEAVVSEMIAAATNNPSQFVHIVNQLQPVSSVLMAPLARIYRSPSRPAFERAFAASYLASYAANDAASLVELLLDADSKLFQLLLTPLQKHRDQAILLCQAELAKVRVPSSDPRDRDGLARRQANAALAIWRLDRPTSILHQLDDSDDRTVRTFIVSRLVPFGIADADAIASLAQAAPNEAIQRALILCLAESQNLESTKHSRTVNWLMDIFQNDDDPGVHAAAECVLDRLGEQQALVGLSARLRLSEDRIQERCASLSRRLRSWHINGHGQTFVVFQGPLQFPIGSPPDEFGRKDDETPYTVRLPRSFAIANRPVTFGEFDELMSDRTDIARIQYDPRVPRFMVSWYDAATYCNRLSQSEGLSPDQWCYETNEQGLVTRLRENHLSLSGYRLPTEAELEYAVRAGAKTRRCYGEADELLVKYAWYVPNSAGSPHPVAQLLPNDYGLFDPLGNLWNWCHDSPRKIQELPYSPVIDDLETDLVVGSRPRALHGGCYTDHSFWLRSAYRWERDPTSSSPIIGFRVARTIGRD